MNTLTLLGIAVSLAMDAFSVSITSGVIIKKPGFRHYFRVAFHFGLFQFFMPILGYWGGVFFESLLKQYDHWIAFLLLLFTGGKMFWESFVSDDDGEGKIRIDPTRGKTLIMLAVATSIDALAIGFSLATLGIPILYPCTVIGLICLIFSAAGMYLGSRIGNRIGSWAERFGGTILIIIGLKILLEHLLA